MAKAKKTLSVVLAALMLVFTFASYVPAMAAKAPAVPKLEWVTEPAFNETGDRISMTVTSPNYGGQVEYRVMLWNGTTKTYGELWPNDPGYYYKNWKPAGNYKFNIHWPAEKLEPGAYSITVLVRRAGSKVSYDSFVKSDALWVKGEATAESVVALEDITVTQGEEAKLPEKVKVNMSDKTVAEMPVTWEAVDTTKVGEFEAKGKVNDTELEVTVKVIVKAEDFTVKSVSAITNTKVKITLANAIKFAPEASTFAIKGVDGKALEVKSVALSLDKKAIILTTDAQVAYAAYTLTAGELSKTFVGVPADTTNPTASATVDSYISVVVAFDEVVDEVSATNIANYKIDNNLNVLKAELDSTGKKVTLTTSPQTVGTIYNLVVTNVTDLAGNAMDKLDTYFGGMSKDTSNIVVNSATVQDYNEVKVVFSKDVDEATATNITNYKIDNNLAVLKAVVDEDDATIVYLTTSDQVVGTIYEITINNILDTLGNGMAKAYSTYFGGMAKDLSKPTALVAVSDSNKVTVKFDKRVSAETAENVANYAIDNGLAVLKAALGTDEMTVTLTTAEQKVGTIYAITIQNVKSAVGTAMDKTTQYFGGMSKDTQGPSIVSVTSDVNKVVILFDEVVDAASATELTNYVFDGGLGYPTKAVLTAEGASAKKEVTLTTGPQTGGKVYYVTVSNVKDANGNTIDTANNASKKAFVGKATAAGTAVVKYLAATVVNCNTIDLIFDTELEGTDIVGITVAIDSVTTLTHPGLSYKEIVQDNAKIVRVQYKTTASENPDLFKQGTVYKATVSGFASLEPADAVKNNNNTRNFAGTTVANAAPAVKIVVPVDSTTLKVVFTEPVTGIVSGSFLVDGGAITGVSVLNTDVVEEVLVYHAATTQGRVYKLQPQAGFTDAAGFVAGKVTDTDGNPLEYAFAGTTVANAKPAIKAVVPVDKYNFDIVFSEAVDATDAEAAIYTITNITDKADLTLTGATKKLSSDGTKLTISLVKGNDELVQGKVYKLVTISTIKDLSGLAMDVATDSTTNCAQFAGTNVANPLPEIVAVTVSTDRTKLTVVFSEKVNGTVDATSLVLTAKGYTAGTVYSKVTTTNNKTYTIELSGALDASQIGSISATETIKDINGQGAKTTAVQFGIQ